MFPRSSGTHPDTVYCAEYGSNGSTELEREPQLVFDDVWRLSSIIEMITILAVYTSSRHLLLVFAQQLACSDEFRLAVSVPTLTACFALPDDFSQARRCDLI